METRFILSNKQFDCIFNNTFFCPDNNVFVENDVYVKYVNYILNNSFTNTIGRQSFFIRTSMYTGSIESITCPVFTFSVTYF